MSQRPTTPVPDLAIGAEIDGYRLEAVAGRGGSSVVFRATELVTGEPVAAKFLVAPDPSARRRLTREAELLAAIDHPGVVPFRALVQNGERAMLVTDWIDGESLRARLRRAGPLDPGEAVDLVAGLAEPLDHLHDRGVLHRDLSPANIIVDGRGRPVVIDLGIGHELDASTLTNDDLLAGTPTYLAPEIIRGEGADRRSDQYSVGIVVHELVAGEPPFPRAGEIATALHHQLSSAPPPLDEVDPSIPAPLADAVLRALAKHPEDRHPTMAAFAAEAAGAAAIGRSGPSRPRSRRRWPPRPLIAAGGLVALVLAGVVAAIGLGFGRDDGTTIGSATPTTAAPVTAEAPTEPTTQPDQPSTTVRPGAVLDLADGWAAGTAAGLDCNLLAGHGFENGSVPTDYFGNPPGRERVVTDEGYEGSWALEVGLVDDYGQYGEIVAVSPGVGYTFLGWFDRRGEIADAQFGVAFLDADYSPNADPGVAAAIPGIGPGFLTVAVDEVPADAAFAVPFLFKDASPGVLLADELVFGETATCVPLATGG